MKNTTIGGNKRKAVNFLAITGLVIIFAAYMFPFLMVVINSLKQKRDIIKSPFSWLYTIKGLSFDNFVKAFTQMDFLNAFKNSLIVTVSATVLVTLLAAMLAYYIVRQHIRRYAECSEPQDYLDFHAHRIFHGNVCVHVPWVHQGECPDCAGRSSVHRRLHTLSDIFQNRASVAETDYINDGDFELDGFLE